MKNSELVKAFFNGATSGKASNLQIEGDRLVNYQTALALRTASGFILNVTKYSVTTSKIQSYVKYYAPEFWTILLDNVSINTRDLYSEMYKQSKVAA